MTNLAIALMPGKIFYCLDYICYFNSIFGTSVRGIVVKHDYFSFRKVYDRFPPRLLLLFRFIYISLQTILQNSIFHFDSIFLFAHFCSRQRSKEKKFAYLGVKNERTNCTFHICFYTSIYYTPIESYALRSLPIPSPNNIFPM